MNNQDLINKAKEVAKNAYAPYSNFKVGACILCENGNTYTGCNVENASYSLALCAERNALSTLIANAETSPIKSIAVVSLNADKCYPCGACREWLRELANDAEILIEEGDEINAYKAKEFLPLSTNYSFKA